MEDRQAERRFRAWRIVQDYEETAISEARNSSGTINLSGDLKDAIEFLNRTFDGQFCDSETESDPVPWISVRWYSEKLTGNRNRHCIFPRKARVMLSGLVAQGAFLPQVDLRGARLEKADLSRAELSGANFSDAMLFNSDFSDGEFIGTDFSQSCLFAANFQDAVLIEADFSGAYLIGANFSNSVLYDANFSGAYVADDVPVNAIRELSNNRDTPNNNDDDGRQGIFYHIFGKITIPFSKFAIETTAFKRLCGKLLASTRNKFPLHMASGIFGRYIDRSISEMAEDIGGVNFSDAIGLKRDQLDSLGCSSQWNAKVLREYRFPPRGLPETISWKENCE